MLNIAASVYAHADAKQYAIHLKISNFSISVRLWEEHVYDHYELAHKLPTGVKVVVWLWSVRVIIATVMRSLFHAYCFSLSEDRKAIAILRSVQAPFISVDLISSSLGISRNCANQTNSIRKQVGNNLQHDFSCNNFEARHIELLISGEITKTRHKNPDLFGYIHTYFQSKNVNFNFSLQICSILVILLFIQVNVPFEFQHIPSTKLNRGPVIIVFCWCLLSFYFQFKNIEYFCVKCHEKGIVSIVDHQFTWTSMNLIILSVFITIK